ncbi:MAG: DUF1810 domain-containing protein [Clostridia bacterium]|nr:DUF1810 domain-containing protein [Clostridia bacterium]
MENKDYKIKRFYYEHRLNYDTALREIKNERKDTHWIWYIFPQLKVLGRSDTAKYYGIENIGEAKAYYDDPYLGEKLREICYALLECKSSNPLEVMGYPDNLKLRSSMTLFYIATGDELFKKVLDKFYDGREDLQTVAFLQSLR